MDNNTRESKAAMKLTVIFFFLGFKHAFCCGEVEPVSGKNPDLCLQSGTAEVGGQSQWETL